MHADQPLDRTTGADHQCVLDLTNHSCHDRIHLFRVSNPEIASLRTSAAPSARVLANVHATGSPCNVAREWKPMMSNNVRCSLSDHPTVNLVLVSYPSRSTMPVPETAAGPTGLSIHGSCPLSLCRSMEMQPKLVNRVSDSCGGGGVQNGRGCIFHTVGILRPALPRSAVPGCTVCSLHLRGVMPRRPSAPPRFIAMDRAET